MSPLKFGGNRMPAGRRRYGEEGDRSCRSRLGGTVCRRVAGATGKEQRAIGVSSLKIGGNRMPAGCRRYGEGTEGDRSCRSR